MLQQHIEICPLCGHPEFELHLEGKDHLVSKQTFKVVQCSKCHFLFTNPRPKDENLSDYYRSEEYLSHHSSNKGLIPFLYRTARRFALGYKFQVISKYVPQGILLDYGCGTGHFLNFFIRQGWEGYGIEPDNDARQVALEENPGIVYSSLEEHPRQSYSVITLWHVLEHLPDLNGVFSKLAGLLKPNGIMVLALPNHQSKDSTIYKHHWAGYDLPRHLYHFDKTSLRKLVKKHGLKVRGIHPLKFDSYYVSLLSERYRKQDRNRTAGVFSYVRAFVNGWRSNSYARKHNDTYSSLIYILQK